MGGFNQSTSKFSLKGLLFVYGLLCVHSGGKEKEGDLKYYPFRMTPYLMKVQDFELSEEHFCCLILAERVNSGYEGSYIYIYDNN